MKTSSLSLTPCYSVDYLWLCCRFITSTWTWQEHKLSNSNSDVMKLFALMHLPPNLIKPILEFSVCSFSIDGHPFFLLSLICLSLISPLIYPVSLWLMPRFCLTNLTHSVLRAAAFSLTLCSCSYKGCSWIMTSL